MVCSNDPVAPPAASGKEVRQQLYQIRDSGFRYFCWRDGAPHFTDKQWGSSRERTWFSHESDVRDALLAICDTYGQDVLGGCTVYDYHHPCDGDAIGSHDWLQYSYDSML